MPYDKNDWDIYQTLRGRNDNPRVLWLHRGAIADCCLVQDGIEILSPTTELEELAEEKDDYNHLSYVLPIKYGGRRIILGGDATVEIWENICTEEYDIPHIQFSEKPLVNLNPELDALYAKLDKIVEKHFAFR